MNDIGHYEERTFPAFRTPTLDILDLGMRKHHIPVLLEVDVTEARKQIQSGKTQTGKGLSITGWVVTCIGQAVSEHKPVHAMRKGRKHLILFDDVDISIVVERAVGDRDHPSETLPMPYVVRKANAKTVNEIHEEIRTAQATSFGTGEVQLGTRRDTRLTRVFTMLPPFLRTVLVWRRLMHDPFFAKNMMGTVTVTSMGSIATSGGYGWAIPIGVHPLIISLGSIARKPGLVGDEITIREYLSMTVLFDHDVTDGAPVARFLRRLKELLESGYGLDTEGKQHKGNRACSL